MSETTTTTIVKSDGEVYDALVVGSGATGGTAAKQLTEAGLKVLVLEAGPPFKGGGAYGNQVTNVARQLFKQYVTRRQPVQRMHGGYWEVNPELFIDDVDNPYTTPKDKPYRWIRGRQVGGRSHTWGGVTLRFSDYEFKAAARDGYGEDWPLSHADLDPYYTLLEEHLGTHGSREGLPQLPDGAFREAAALSDGERVFKERVEKAFPDRKVIPSRGIQAARHPGKGEVFSRLSSQGSTLAAAEATGRLTVRANAVVSRVLTDPATGRATGVEFVDRETRELHAARARVVFLCASTLESLRILMLSKSAQHPDGLGASSGLLGRQLMDHIVGNAYFYMPEVPDDGKGRFPLLGSDSIVIPRYQNLGAGREGYIRGFGMWGGIQRLPFPPILQKRRGVAFGFLCAMGEALPHADNHMTLDAEVKDAWGLPVPHISCTWTENDLTLARAAQAAAEEMVRVAGGVVEPLNQLVRTPLVEGFMAEMQAEWTPTTPGLFVHEVGGARMGTDRKTSVTDPFCALWDAPNVYVSDGACWVSSGWQNPTLTEMAITARAAHHAAEALKRGDL
jgi:choline dehydrogenase-like flavoprotein